MAAQKRPGFRLKGLEVHVKIGELEIDAHGDDAAGLPQLRGIVADQVAKAIRPVTQGVVQGLLPGVDVTPAAPVPTPASATTVDVEKRRRSPRPRAANSPADGSALSWKPNSNPSLGWSNGKKALWLIYFHSKENGGTESAPKGLTIPVVVATYNKHFPHAKPIKSSHVYRDLNKYAAANPALVTPDRNVNPPVWYVTPAGVAVVEEMLKAAGASATSAA
ncbi:hypothetical protein [Anaeromyxobacter dehalogenans]|nr:hypothetical protein [Anaeromyxobacter dehalogenans]